MKPLPASFAVALVFGLLACSSAEEEQREVSVRDPACGYEVALLAVSD